MPQLGSPVSTPSGMPGINQAHLGKMAGLHVHFPSMAAFTAAIASGTAVGASTDLWSVGQPITISGEPFVAKRFWNGSHARTVLLGVAQFVLAANTNVVLPTSGAPGSGTGNNGDLAVDMTSGLAYVKSGGAWGAGVSFGGISTGGGGGGSAGTLQFSAGTYSVGEGGGTLTIPVTRTGGSTGAASVAYATANGSATAGSDYTAASGTLNWTDGDAASKNIVITIAQDSTVEGAETFTVALSNATGASLGSTTSATVTINDDDSNSNAIVLDQLVGITYSNGVYTGGPGADYTSSYGSASAPLIPSGNAGGVAAQIGNLTGGPVAIGLGFASNNQPFTGTPGWALLTSSFQTGIALFENGVNTFVDTQYGLTGDILVLRRNGDGNLEVTLNGTVRYTSTAGASSNALFAHMSIAGENSTIASFIKIP